MDKFRNQADSENKNSTEITNSEQRTPENLLNRSSNPGINKTPTDITTTAKKDINYIFQLNVTKKKLETIQKKVEKLLATSAGFENELNDKYALQQMFVKQYYALDLKYKRNFIEVTQRMASYGIEDPGVLLDPAKRDDFLNAYIDNCQIILNDQFSTELNTHSTIIENDSPEEIKNKQQALDAKKEELDKTLPDLLTQESESMAKILDDLAEFYFNVQVEATVLNQKKKDIDTLAKEMNTLQKKFSDISNRIKKEQEKYNEVTAHGLLKSYEVSWSKISINDMIAHPSLELQMKKLIALYNNQTEAKKFWLSLPKGILFVGEPETWKTFAAKMFASEIDRKMYHIKASDLLSEDSTDPNQMLYVIFYSIIDHVNKNKESCVIFLDEIEKIIESMWEYSQVEQKIISNTIIKNIVNIQQSNLDITIIAALSNKNKIDPRFMKHDLFDNQFYFELPKPEERKKLFELYIAKAEKRAELELFDKNIIDDLVKKTEWFSAEYIKQLINTCVKEYLYLYLNKKASFAIDETFIWTALAKIDDTKKLNSSENNPILRKERRKIVSMFMTKNPIFGISDTDTKEQSAAIKKFILDHTDTYSDTDMYTLMNALVDEYQRRKSEYHKQSLIQKDSILDKIQMLREEDKTKKNGLYLNYR